MQKQTHTNRFLGAVLILAQVMPVVGTSQTDPGPLPSPEPYELTTPTQDVELSSHIPLKPEPNEPSSLEEPTPTPQVIEQAPSSLPEEKASKKPASPEKAAAEPVQRSIPAVSAGQLDNYFTLYADAVNIDSNLLKHISYCESHHNPAAVNGPYGGLFQFSSSTWASTRQAMGLDPDPALRFDAEQAINTAAWKIAHGGISAWPVCGKRALASK